MKPTNPVKLANLEEIHRRKEQSPGQIPVNSRNPGEQMIKSITLDQFPPPLLRTLLHVLPKKSLGRLTQASHFFSKQLDSEYWHQRLWFRYQVKVKTEAKFWSLRLEGLTWETRLVSLRKALERKEESLIDYLLETDQLNSQPELVQILAQFDQTQRIQKLKGRTQNELARQEIPLCSLEASLLDRILVAGFVGAAQGGHLETVRKYLQAWNPTKVIVGQPETPIEQALPLAIENGHFEILAEFLTRQLVARPDAVFELARNGYQPKVQSFLTQYPGLLLEALEGAAVGGQVKLLEWLMKLRSFQPTILPGVIDSALDGGKVGVLHLFIPHIEVFTLDQFNLALKLAIRANDLPLYHQFLEAGGEWEIEPRDYESLAKVAIEAGNLPILEEILAKEEFTPRTMEGLGLTALREGQVEILSFLLERGVKLTREVEFENLLCKKSDLTPFLGLIDSSLILRAAVRSNQREIIQRLKTQELDLKKIDPREIRGVPPERAKGQIEEGKEFRTNSLSLIEGFMSLLEVKPQLFDSVFEWCLENHVPKLLRRLLLARPRYRPQPGILKQLWLSNDRGKIYSLVPPKYIYRETTKKMEVVGLAMKLLDLLLKYGGQLIFNQLLIELLASQSPYLDLIVKLAPEERLSWLD